MEEKKSIIKKLNKFWSSFNVEGKFWCLYYIWTTIISIGAISTIVILESTEKNSDSRNNALKILFYILTGLNFIWLLGFLVYIETVLWNFIKRMYRKCFVAEPDVHKCMFGALCDGTECFRYIVSMMKLKKYERNMMMCMRALGLLLTGFLLLLLYICYCIFTFMPKPPCILYAELTTTIGTNVLH